MGSRGKKGVGGQNRRGRKEHWGSRELGEEREEEVKEKKEDEKVGYE